MTPPETVDCATCGGVARRAAWGATHAVCYRCTDCHAGGHIADGDVRQGGVFRSLRNYATRRVDA